MAVTLMLQSENEMLIFQPLYTTYRWEQLVRCYCGNIFGCDSCSDSLGRGLLTLVAVLQVQTQAKTTLINILHYQLLRKNALCHPTKQHRVSQ